MSLQVWLPLNGNLNNQGLADINLTNTVTFATPGKIGQSCLNSQLGWFAVPEMAGKKQMSFAYWVRLNAGTSTNWLDPFSWYSTNGTSDYRCRQEFYYYNSNGNTEAMTTGVWYYNASNSGVTQRNIGQWYHYAFTIDYETGITQFFVDGTLWKTTTNADKSHYIKGNNFLLRESALDCSINDFRLYDHCLSQKEVEEISKGLVLHYKLDDISNITATSSLHNLIQNGNANQGTEKWTNWGTATNRSIVNINGKNWFHHTSDASGNKYGGFNQDGTNEEIKPNTDYTISALIYASGPTQVILWFHMRSTEGGANISQPSKTFTVSTTPTICTYTFNSGTNANYTINRFNIMIGSRNNSSANDVYVTDIIMTEGTTAVSYIPNPNDSAYIALGQNLNIVYDSSGYGNHGTSISSPVPSNNTIRYKNSLLFDGIDDAIQFPYNQINPSGIFTVNLWFYKSELGSKNYETLFGGPSGFEMDTRSNSSTTLSLYMASIRGGNAFSPFVLNTWYMITMVRDGINELYYVNGNLVKTIEAKSMPTGTYYIGAWNVSTSQNYKGNISDFRLYATVLTEEQIKELYNTSATIDNNGNIYSRDFIENDNLNITKTGLFQTSSIEDDDNGQASIFKTKKILGTNLYEY